MLVHPYAINKRIVLARSNSGTRAIDWKLGAIYVMLNPISDFKESKLSLLHDGYQTRSVTLVGITIEVWRPVM